MTDPATRYRNSEGLGHYAGIRNGDLMRERGPNVTIAATVVAGFITATALAVLLLG